MSKYGMGLLRSARLTRRQLITFALVSAVLNGVVTACVGTWLAQTYATQQSRRKSVETLAHLIYDRRTRAGMVVSSLRRNALPEEIQYRKRAYDEAYVDWNKNILLNLFAIREVAGDLKFTTLVKAFEDELVASMADVDRCLTKAFDAKLAGAGPGPPARRLPHGDDAPVRARLRRDLHRRALQADADLRSIRSRARWRSASGSRRSTSRRTARDRRKHRRSPAQSPRRRPLLTTRRATTTATTPAAPRSTTNARDRACISAGAPAGDSRGSEPSALSRA